MRILHTNDFHGKLDPTRVDRLRQLKAEHPDTLYFDSGDAIRTGNLGVPLRPEVAWERLAEAGCDASVLGNRETHILPAAFRAKLEGHRHPVLCANLVAKDGKPPLPPWVILACGGVRVGVFGVMVPMVTRRMKTQAASAYLWDDPVETAQESVAVLRGQVDVIVALTHIGHRKDQALAEAVPGIDIILGGHSHTVIQEPERMGDTWIAQGGSHGHYVGVYEWNGGRLTGGLRTFDQ
jgi:2',3'-cyclic-nucleotide 2'-phosphodiesterase (5'-nucleotidase family)